MTPSRTREPGESGFTLLEAMIAMAIMGIGLLTIALAQVTSMRMSSHSRQMTQAMYLAEQQLNAFYVSPPAAPGTFQDPGNPIDLDANDQDLTTFNRSWTVQTNTPSAGMSTVLVTVVWNTGPGGLDVGLLNRTVNLRGVVRP